MSDDNLVLEHLRAIRTTQDDMRDEIREIKHRLTALESGQANIIRHISHPAETGAVQQSRYDRLAERVERIERRLELSE
jgi:polyhydroxyalkanoate synthesis regulator phasin